MRRRNDLRTVLVWLCFAAAAELALWPSFSDALANFRQSAELSGYETACGLLDHRDKELMKRAAVSYNAVIASEQKQKSFAYRGANATDAAYESLLSQEGGIMAWLSVPRIGIDLPVVHGTKEEDLKYRCGHMYGTSLPVGGPDTHAVIAAHTGLPSAELFSRLTEMNEGDRFLIRVIGETHVYEVREVRVVWPEEEPAYLGIRDGEDLVTLYTCTPYGINDRRLLVEGTRILPDPEPEETEDSLPLTWKNRTAAVRAAVLGSIGPGIALMGLFLRRRTKRKEVT